MTRFRRAGTRPQEFFAAMAVLGVVGPLVGCTTPTSGSSTSPSGTSKPAATMDGYVRLERGAHPLARPKFDIGPLDPDRRITNLAIVFKLSPQQERDRDGLLAAQLDRTSPNYRKWLTPGEYAARFGAKAADIARTRAWLARQGLDIGSTSPLGVRVSFAGRVADLQTAFRTEIHAYQVGGEIHYAMSSAPAVPRELSDVVLALHNTHDFYARPALTPTTIIPQAVCPDGGYCDVSGTHNLGLAPRDWATIYDVNPLYATGVAGSPLDGSGATIAIVGRAPIALSDVRAFRSMYGLPEANITEVEASTQNSVPNTGAAQVSPDDVQEAMIDTEWSGGIAPGANIVYVFSGADGNVSDAVYYAIEQNIAPILSESFGGCELNLIPSDADVLGVYGSAANLLGVTYIASSGDSDATGCLNSRNKMPESGLYTQFPASFPGITAVGGTEFPTNALAFDCNGATAYSSAEQVWNDGERNGFPSGGGGGISVVFSQPPYQTTTCPMVGTLPGMGEEDASTPPVPPTPPKMREVPDIALTADAARYPYYIECTPVLADSGILTGCSASGGNPVLIATGGTSAGTPSFAGVLALAYQAVGGRLGNINPFLYALQATTPGAFHDITAGSNMVACTPGMDPGCPPTCPVPGFAPSCYGYQAAPGYDCASGLGAIDAAKLVRAWADATTTTTTLTVPSRVTAGSSVSLMATIDAGANNTAIGGDVTFTYQSPWPTFSTPPESYAMLGGPMTITSAGTATLAGYIPVGVVRPGAQFVEVSAAYGGDPQHLASTSATVRVSFTGVDLCIPQASANALPDGQIAYSASGGVGPIAWFPDSDTTCDEHVCSVIDETTGVFRAGPVPGYVVVEAFDEGDGAFALSFVTVGTPSTPPPWGTAAPSACPPGDAGELADADVDVEVSEDSDGAEDATAIEDATTTQDATGDATTPTQDAAIPAETGTDAGEHVPFAGWPSTPCPPISADSGLDASGSVADAQSELQVNSSKDAPSDGPGSSPADANNDAPSNSSSPTENDAEANQSFGSSSSSCGCVTAGRNSSPMGGYGASVLGLGLMARRRRLRRLSQPKPRLTAPIAVPSGTLTSVPFDTVEFDLNTEYSATTGVLTPKISGVYIIICQFQYVMSTDTSAGSATITKNGADFIESDSPTLPPISGGDAHCDAEVTTTRFEDHISRRAKEPDDDDLAFRGQRDLGFIGSSCVHVCPYLPEVRRDKRRVFGIGAPNSSGSAPPTRRLL